MKQFNFPKAILSLGIVLMLGLSLFHTKASAAEPGFSDVKSTDYFHDSVQWAVTNGITSGTSATTFSPNATCTRGQVATFLYAAAKGSLVTFDNRFSDISKADYYYNPVLWAVKNGITSGTSYTTFSPNEGCTRAQVVTFLWRAAGSPEPKSTRNPFRDVASSDYYFKAVLWAAEQGITGGTSANTFSPGMQCTRGQIVTFLSHCYASVLYSASITLHDSSTNQRIETLGDSFDLADIQDGTYASFTMTITNQTTAPLTVTDSYVIVNNGTPLGWMSFTLAPGQSTYLHIYSENMMKYTYAGTHTATWYINGLPVLTKELKFTESVPEVDTTKFWQDVFPIPTQAEITAYNISSPAYRSPYIAGWLQIGKNVKFTEYSIDFKADHVPKGTYCSLANWYMDLSDLKKTHTNVHTNSGSIMAYAGLQNTITSKGTTSIMSFWDVFATDRYGKDVVIRAKLVYPEPDGDEDFGNEGTGAHCIRSFDWEPNHWYRMLLQCSTSPETGNTQVEQWVCDLETNQWTKLCVYDTGLKNSCFVGDVAFFLENYIKELAGDVRSMEVRNPRIRKVNESSWTNLTQAYMTSQGGIPNYNGSYAFGAKDDRFRMITSGVGGDWYNNGKGQAAKTYTIKNTATGNPY